MKTTKGVLIGEAAATISSGICHVFAIKTTDDITVELPPQEIIPFEYYKLPREDIDEDSTDKDYSSLVNKTDKVIKPSLGALEPGGKKLCSRDR